MTSSSSEPTMTSHLLVPLIGLLPSTVAGSPSHNATALASGHEARRPRGPSANRPRPQSRVLVGSFRDVVWFPTGLGRIRGVARHLRPVSRVTHLTPPASEREWATRRRMVIPDRRAYAPVL